MAQYTVVAGTHDPHRFEATADAEAYRQAAALLLEDHGGDFSANPQEVVTLLGPGGLLTRPGERIDEFVARVTAINPAGDSDVVQPGDSNTPDCNGD